MSCNCTATIMAEIAEIKSMIAELHQARRGQDDLTGQPFTISPRDADRRAASLAHRAALDRKSLRQSG